MKLSINQESVYALREYAEVIPKIISNISIGMEKLFSTYTNVIESIGPHRNQFEEMMYTIKVFNNTTSEFIEELPYMLNCTADKMESYIGHGAFAKGMGAIEGNDLENRYNNAINARLLSDDIDKDAKGVYERFRNDVRIIDYNYGGTPYYDPRTKGISINYMADMHNPVGSFYHYFHEVGHMIDDNAGEGITFISANTIFHNNLINDAERYIQQTMLSECCEREEAFDYISDELYGPYYAEVSDIFGSLTECRCQGSWGHDRNYWNRDESLVEKEAFANMFAASMGSKQKQDMMEKYFPASYNRFKKILGEIK